MTDFPEVIISADAITKIAIEEQLRIINSKLDRLYKFFELSYNRHYILSDGGTWKKRRKARTAEEFELEQEMKKFTQGFAYVPRKTSRNTRKKPELHSMEPKGNKRKPKKD